MQQPLFDDLVGLDDYHAPSQARGLPGLRFAPGPAARRRLSETDSLLATFDKPRLDRFIDQIRGYTAPRPLLPAGLAPFRTLPPAESPMHTRTRMAAAIAEAVAANGNVTREELLARGFTVEEIATHFTEAKRAARVERMSA